MPCLCLAKTCVKASVAVDSAPASVRLLRIRYASAKKSVH
jgi:hypothetical protein